MTSSLPLWFSEPSASTGAGDGSTWPGFLAAAFPHEEMSLFELGFSVKADSDIDGVVWQEVSAIALSYRCFLGDIIMRDESVDLSMMWEWIPVFDFALSLRWIAEGLLAGKDGVFDFTESGLEIHFRLRSQRVEIAPDWLTETILVDLATFDETSRSLLLDVRRYMHEAHPGIDRNPHYKRTLGRFWTPLQAAVEGDTRAKKPAPTMVQGGKRADMLAWSSRRRLRRRSNG